MLLLEDLDGFFHNNINLWDVAAGEILVKEAGGIVNELNDPINNIDIKASSASINDKMLKSLINFLLNTNLIINQLILILFTAKKS